MAQTDNSVSDQAIDAITTPILIRLADGAGWLTGVYCDGPTSFSSACDAALLRCRSWRDARTYDFSLGLWWLSINKPRRWGYAGDSLRIVREQGDSARGKLWQAITNHDVALARVRSDHIRKNRLSAEHYRERGTLIEYFEPKQVAEQLAFSGLMIDSASPLGAWFF